MPNVGDSTREALAISWVPEQTTMLPAFDVVGKYSSDDKLTINKLLKLKPGMAVTDDILPVRAADSLGQHLCRPYSRAVPDRAAGLRLPV